MSPETRAIVAAFFTALIVALTVVALTNYLYWQPHLNLLAEQATPKILEISLVSSEGWTLPSVGIACAVVNANSVFRFNITNISNQAVVVLFVEFQASNWGGGSSSGTYNKVLGPGNTMAAQHDWRVSQVSPGNQAQFSVIVTLANLPSQTLTICVQYSST